MATENDHIVPLNINGLKGRMLYLPAKKKASRDILLIYGLHASLERMEGLARDFNQYGSVTLPDLPGFGGMDSFYTIGMKPSLDTYADYLAAFIRLRFKNKKITVIGMSYGFLVVTRMLQKYPRLTGNVNLLISAVGFCHRDDFAFTKARYNFYLQGSRLFSSRPMAFLFRNTALQPVVLRAFYGRTRNAKKKFEGLSPEEAKKSMDFEVHLWRCNEVRTYMNCCVGMLTVDNCHKHISLPVHHITVGTDQYFNANHVEQHMRIVFDDFIEHIAEITVHAPSIGDESAAHDFIPKSIRQLLKKTPGKTPL